jgi:hypothetical protein
MIISTGLSLTSLLLSLYAIIISRRNMLRTREIEFHKIKIELLMKVSDSRKILDNTRIEIGTQKAIFENEPQSVQLLLCCFNSLFFDYLQKIEFSINQSDILWNDISNWSVKKSIADLFHAQAVLYRNIKNDETVYESGIYCINEFKEKLKLAQEQFNLNTVPT